MFFTNLITDLNGVWFSINFTDTGITNQFTCFFQLNCKDKRQMIFLNTIIKKLNGIFGFINISIAFIRKPLLHFCFCVIFI